MDPQDLLNLTTLLNAGRGPMAPPPKDRASMLADALDALGADPPRDSESADQRGPADAGYDPGADRGWPQGASVPTSPAPTLVAAAIRPGYWDHWTVPSCQNCHGYTQSTLPPFGGHFPFGVSPRTGDSGGGGSRSPREEYPQCDMQYQRDTDICTRQPTPKNKAICHASAADRLGYCLDTGELGHPILKTARWQ